jgi:hypothetical protein
METTSFAFSLLPYTKQQQPSRWWQQRVSC